MAQILKIEVKEAIIKAAIKEFLESGFRDASMRTIADNANMTVGNLYRYFKSKEELFEVLVKDTRKQIDKVLWILLNAKFEKVTRVYDVRFDVNDIRKTVDIFAKELINVYKDKPDEVKILLNDDRNKERTVASLKDAIVRIVKQNYANQIVDEEIEILSSSYAIAIYAGIKRIICSTYKDDDLERVLKAFLRGFVAILDEDVYKIMGNN